MRKPLSHFTLQISKKKQVVQSKFNNALRPKVRIKVQFMLLYKK